MESVSVSEFKSKLSEHLRRVKAGERLVITERNIPIATVTGIVQADAETEEAARIQRLIARGQLVPPDPAEKLPDDFWDTPRVADPDGKVLEGLLEERQSGW